MHLNISTTHLQSLIEKRALQLEEDIRRHVSIRREMPQATGNGGRVIPLDGETQEEAEARDREWTKIQRAENDYHLTASTDSIARQVDWMRTFAQIIGSQGVDEISVSLDDLVVLNLWPTARITPGERIRATL